MVCNFREKILTLRLPKVSKCEDNYFVLRSDLFFHPSYKLAGSSVFFFGLSRSLSAIVSTIKGLPFSSDLFTFSNLSVDQTFAMTLLLTLFLVIGYVFPGTMITASMVSRPQVLLFPHILLLVGIVCAMNCWEYSKYVTDCRDESPCLCRDDDFQSVSFFHVLYDPY